MQKIKKTKDYIIYQKRSGRYAVRDRNRKWINKAAKQQILFAEQLIKPSRPKLDENVTSSAESSEIANNSPAVELDKPALE